MTAKIAATMAKPQGLIYVPAGAEKDFLAPLAVEMIPGVGPKTDHFDEATSSGMHVEHMSAFLRSYDDLSTTTRVAVQSAAARRTVTFGSDFEQRPASLAALPVPPLTGRNFGCDLQA